MSIITSEYNKLTARCFAATKSASYKDVERILAEVRRTLETVTDEMRSAALYLPANIDGEEEYYLAMLHASPLEPPK